MKVFNTAMTWDDSYNLAKKYYITHGNLLVPNGYTDDGYNLYAWISKQRYRYSIDHDPKLSDDDRAKRSRTMSPLTDEQVNRLESIGMIWNANDYAWERSFCVAQAYFKRHGNLCVPDNYSEDGVNLSHWIRVQRQIRNGTLPNRKSPLTDEQIRRLDSIGMPWQPYDAMWERAFAVAEKYFHEHGNLIVPKHYSEDGVNLSHWIWTQRRIVAGTAAKGQKLSEEQIRRLENIGMVWSSRMRKIEDN